MAFERDPIPYALVLTGRLGPVSTNRAPVQCRAMSGNRERVLTAFAREPDGGLIVTPSPLTGTRRSLGFAPLAVPKAP